MAKTNETKTRQAQTWPPTKPKNCDRINKRSKTWTNPTSPVSIKTHGSVRSKDGSVGSVKKAEPGNGSVQPPQLQHGLVQIPRYDHELVQSPSLLPESVQSNSPQTGSVQHSMGRHGSVIDLTTPEPPVQVSTSVDGSVRESVGSNGSVRSSPPFAQSGDLATFMTVRRLELKLDYEIERFNKLSANLLRANERLEDDLAAAHARIDQMEAHQKQLASCYEDL